MFPYASVGVLVLILVLTGFFATVSRFSLFILQGLHAYLLPEESDKDTLDLSEGNGAEKQGETAEKLTKKAGKKKKHKDLFDESGAQILRIQLTESQLESRKYFQEYDEAVIYSILGLTNFIMREILQLIARSSVVEKRGWAEALTPDDRISFMVSVFAVYKILRLLAKVNYDPQLARKSERLVTWSVAVLGFAVASAVLISVPTSIIDFGIDEAVVDSVKSASFFMEKKGAGTPQQFSISATCVKLLIAVVAGLVSGLLFSPSLRSVKCFWSGTDQLHWNITVLKRSRLARPFLNLSIVLPMLTILLWVKPVAEVLIRPESHTDSFIFDSGLVHGFGNMEDMTLLGHSHVSRELEEQPTHGENVGCQAGLESQACRVGQNLPKIVKGELGESILGASREKDGSSKFQSHDFDPGVLGKERTQMLQETEEDPGVLSRVFMSRQYDWAAGVGVSKSTFNQIRLWCLVLSGLLQICLLRVNLQTYCDGAVLVWYESLHQSKAYNLEVSKAKIFLNNYFVCRVALQSLVPGVLVLLMIGLARTRGSHLDSLLPEGVFLFAPSFVRVVMHFSSWWLVFSSALQTWVTLALFRIGIMRNTA